MRGGGGELLSSLIRREASATGDLARDQAARPAPSPSSTTSGGKLRAGLVDALAGHWRR